MAFHRRHQGSAAAQLRDRETAAAYADSRHLRLAKTSIRYLEELDAARGDYSKVSSGALLAFRDAVDAVKALNPKAFGGAA
jgi:hypothetical protein